jgi:hypothetical protein
VKQAAAFLKKSGAKNFASYESRDVQAPMPQIKKSLLLLFYRKEVLPSYSTEAAILTVTAKITVLNKNPISP